MRVGRASGMSMLGAEGRDFLRYIKMEFAALPTTSTVSPFLNPQQFEGATAIFNY